MFAVTNLQRSLRAASQSAARMPARGLRKSKAIEEWAAMRENTTEAFQMNGTNLLLSIVFFGVVPLALLKVTVNEQHMRDKENGLPRQKYIGDA